ncbi:MAG: Pantothenate kinase type III, CoaX-like (EC [uncultured Sulfurovum sp.]|uniref:Type III pantothenate kinase n=1 Tax=uncultured Sulfurovum sp. TaxID=269237 RepID=A0A6S6SUW9_9BACT|nr:MAG: Pantothenate kinase type III, CoaX-like (EC [uncultured Sulfurovum sp.]
MRPNEMTSALGVHPNEMTSDFEVNKNTLLADIGNTHFHVYNGKEVEHLSYEDAIKKYATSKIFYISVKSQLDTRVEEIESWVNVSSLVKVEGEYDTLGTDRKALCLSRKNGLFVDAGSAITVDVVEQGVYKGGYIYPGLQAMLKSYADISPALDVELNKNICLDSLALTTKEQISYGIIASIKALIDKHRQSKNLYFTGGDGALLSKYFEGSVYDETLVFQGMLKVL